MNKRYFPLRWLFSILSCYSFIAVDVMAQEMAVSKIPQELLVNANAVVRESQLRFSVEAINAATLHVEHTVTVMNEKGDDQAMMVIYYDEQTKVKKVSYEVLNSQGETVQKIKSKNIKDISVGQGSLYADSRAKIYVHHSNSYPYTIRYTYDVAYNGLLFYPTWLPQDEYGISVEKSSFTCTSPDALSFRYKEGNVQRKPDISHQEVFTTYHWKEEQLVALKAEILAPRLTDMVPVVWTAPNDFEYEGYRGNMSSWSAFGQWISQLNKGRGSLPEATIREVRKLTTGIDDPYLVVKKVYEYMQAKTRYVSIQLGIGGYQPFSASSVDELGYGDCKALSNYMVALLGAVDIPARYTLVRAGKNAVPIRTDFPSTQFNHVIVCVPMPQDTIWLECTSQTEPAGFLGYFTSNRDVLIIDEEGGHMAKTPMYKASENLSSRVASVSLDENGSGKASIETRYTGLQFAQMQDIALQPAVEQRKNIYQKINIASFDVTDHRYELTKAKAPVVTEHLELALKNYATKSSKRLFFNPNLLNKSTLVLPIIAQRETEILIYHGYEDIDSVYIDLPQNSKLEHLPETVSIHSKFGEYESQYKLEAGRLIYIRKCRTFAGKYPASDYGDLKTFYEKIGKADHATVVVNATT